MGIDLTILMPCLNEAETLAGCIFEARRALEALTAAAEVLVCDNGSIDDSVAIARSNGARVIVCAESGYGYALNAGIEAANGTLIIMADSDGSYDFGAIIAFYEQLVSGFDLVVGNRFLGGINPGAMPWLHRYIGNPILSGIGGILFPGPIRDFHCGIRGFRRDAIRSLKLASPGMEFASEMIIRAALVGLRVTEIPATLRPDGRSRPPHLRPWRDGWRHLKLMVRLRYFMRECQ